MRRACLAPSAEDYAALIATAGRVKALDYVMHVRPRVSSAPGQPARGVWQAQCAAWREQSNHLHLTSHLLPLECLGMLTMTSSQPQSVLYYRDGACTDVLYTVLDDADFFRPAQVFCLPAFKNG